jgi:hypothetical protein
MCFHVEDGPRPTKFTTDDDNVVTFWKRQQK